MPKNVYVLGLTDLQRKELATVRAAQDYSFRGLLDYERLVEDTDYDLESLLEQARAELAQHGDSVDAIVCHWDFPSSVIGPILAAEHGIPAPSLRSVLASEHKYWSRLSQRASVPEVVPRFVSFDPFADDVGAQIDLDFPFWVKPVKAHSSNLGFAIHDEAELAAAVEEIRAQITDIGDAFNQALARVELPAELHDADGNTCLAEQIVTGIQAAPEGTVHRGQYRVHGVFDMLKDDAQQSIARLDYPAGTVPHEAQQQMIDVAGRYLAHIGYDNGAFNAEFMWDEAADQLWLIEINTRISQSHSELFILVDGGSNHEVAIDLALGQAPSMPQRQGRYAVAAKCEVFHDSDGTVRRVPSDEEIAALVDRFPQTKVSLHVELGDVLSQVPHQDSYRYILASIYLGGDDHADLGRRHAAAAAMLNFEIDPIEGA
ncbi:ATP-grasp domain-containing protein [Georgenia sp. MJ170]|uniref:ATP-grasp domain-containing protein n=1 Tax=Georgenia sunbinii TaxID=3117728 RepID=UPI002F26D919